MSLEQSIIEKLRLLSTEKQQEVLDFVEFLGQKHTIVKHPRRNWIGSASDLKVDLTEEDIAEARREMWGNFPREDI